MAEQELFYSAAILGCVYLGFFFLNLWCQCPFLPERPQNLVNPPSPPGEQFLSLARLESIPHLCQPWEFSCRSGKELVIIPDTQIRGLNIPVFPEPKQTQISAAGAGWAQGGALPLPPSGAGLKIHRAERKGLPAHGWVLERERHFKPSLSDSARYQVQCLIENAEIKALSPLISSHPLHTPSFLFHLLPQPSAGWELGIFTPPRQFHRGILHP